MNSQGLRRCAIALAATCALVGGTAFAQQSTTLSGATAEGIKVKLTVADTGNATVFRIGATTAECEAGHLQTDPATFKKFDISDPGAFTDKRKGKRKDGRYLLRDTFVTTGEIGADGSSWSGTYDKTTRVLKDGRKIDTCVLSTTWEAN